MTDWRTHYLADLVREFGNQRSLAERAVAQLDDADLLRTIGEDENSIAILMKHVGGNLRSRWTEPFTTDGEKPERHRDGEFVVAVDEARNLGPTEACAGVRRTWQDGWADLEATLGGLRPEDLDRELRIRGEPLSLVTALHRSLAHTAQHVGQIILLARHWRGAEWKTLSIPKKVAQ